MGCVKATKKSYLLGRGEPSGTILDEQKGSSHHSNFSHMHRKFEMWSSGAVSLYLANTNHLLFVCEIHTAMAFLSRRAETI